MMDTSSLQEVSQITVIATQAQAGPEHAMEVMTSHKGRMQHRKEKQANKRKISRWRDRAPGTPLLLFSR